MQLFWVYKSAVTEVLKSLDSHSPQNLKFHGLIIEP